MHERCTATATPGSRQILVAIAESGVYRQLVEGGVRMLEPVCGPCVGMGQAPPSDANSLRTFNRNFPGRSGTPDDSVYLCSPAVAAVSMLHGEIRDPREYGEPPELLEMPELKPYVDDVHIFAPAPEEEAERIEIPRGPNIKTPPEHSPLEDELSARIATVQPDNISTGRPGARRRDRHVLPLEHPGHRRVHLPAPRPRVPRAHEGVGRAASSWAATTTARAPRASTRRSRRCSSACARCSPSRSPASTAATSWRRGSSRSPSRTRTTTSSPRSATPGICRNVKRELEEGAERISVRIEESGRELELEHDLAPKEREILVQRRAAQLPEGRGGGCLTPAWTRSWCASASPALAGREVFFDGPGGSQAPAEVIDAMVAYLRGSNANLGGAFRTSAESDAVHRAARAAAADFTGSEPEEIAFGANMTTLNFLLAHAVARTLEPGDEIVVTDLDHDANVAPWLLVAGDHDLVVRRRRSAPPTARSTTTRSRRSWGSARAWWRSRSPRTRSARSRTPRGSPPRPRAWARSRGPTPCTSRPTAACARAELGIDVLLCSPYKFFGPHLGVAAIERGLAESLPADRVRPAEEWPPGHRFETGTQSHEAIAGATAAIEYLRSAGRRRPRHRVRADTRPRGGAVAPLPGGGCPASPASTSTGSPIPAGWGSARPPSASTSATGSRARLAAELAARDIYVWDGDYYALAPMRALGLAERGAVRAGFLHYTTEDEVDRLLGALAELA